MSGVDLGRYRRIVQMFWDPEPSNDQKADQAVWCLGVPYKLSSNDLESGEPCGGSSPSSNSPTLNQIGTHDKQEPLHVEESEAATAEAAGHLDEDRDRGWPSAFLEDFESRFWMTYRSDFLPIPRSTDPRAVHALSLSMRIKSQLVDQNGFSSDSGWGCMIRSGQSLLANTMAIHELGRDWRRGADTVKERQLLAKFADDPQAPYSIHQFVQHGASFCGKYPGEWFGPSATARCIQALADKNESRLRVYSTGDGPDVYQDKFMRIAKPEGQPFHPTLILVGTRLGIDKITPVYWEALIAALQMPQSVGIAGGRPSSSHYFVGAQASFLFYLDPHHTRPALPFRDDPERYSEADVDSVHTRRLRRLHVREMDPSMLIGFLIQDEDDWEEWKRNVKHVQGKAVIHVAEYDPTHPGGAGGRDGAIDEVEILSDDDDEVTSDTHSRP